MFPEQIKKTMKKALLPILTLAFALTFSSCSKDDDDQAGTTSKSRTELLVNKSWIMTGATVSPAYDFGNGETTNLYGEYDACEKDDFLFYNANLTYTGDDGASKCDPQASQTWTGTWSISADQQLLTRDGDAHTIASMSETKMVLTNQQEIGGVVYTSSYTWTKK